MPPAKKILESTLKACTTFVKKENIKNISMGMSNDYKEAIICGATTVRIGSLIFGEEKANYYANNLLPWKKILAFFESLESLSKIKKALSY